MHTIVKRHSLLGPEVMAEAVGGAVAAYNSDVNEEGVTPLQAGNGKGGNGSPSLLSWTSTGSPRASSTGCS